MIPSSVSPPPDDRAFLGHPRGLGYIAFTEAWERFSLLNSIGFSNVFPVGLALYSKSAPKAVAGTIMGVYYLHLFAGNNLVGWLGGLLEKMPGTQFWLLHVGLVGGSAAVMFLASRLPVFRVAALAPPKSNLE